MNKTSKCGSLENQPVGHTDFYLFRLNQFEVWKTRKTNKLSKVWSSEAVVSGLYVQTYTRVILGYILYMVVFSFCPTLHHVTIREKNYVMGKIDSEGHIWNSETYLWARGKAEGLIKWSR